MNLPVEIAQFVQLLESLGNGWPAILLIGLLAGFIARSFTTTEKQIGLFSTLAVGVAGALGAAEACRYFDIRLAGLGSRFIAAIVGSLVLLLVLGFVRGLFPAKKKSGESRS